MTKRKEGHTFHIPVMGIGFTIDSPIKVAQYGISSVISLVDDSLMEKMREYYSKKFNLPFKEITEKIDDFRSKRITSYLNMVDEIVMRKFTEFKKNLAERRHELEHYIETLPDISALKHKLTDFIETHKPDFKEIKEFIDKHLKAGSIDVNIMTKLDRVNYKCDEELPHIYNDAHAALRGFAQSTLHSSIVLSAGMNPRLYTYFEEFEDFYPDTEGNLKKKIILKVSDFRSALIQGKVLAKKGIWISEYRIESGLNCGGHAFATDGFLLGPILEEFKTRRSELSDDLFTIYQEALKEKGKPCPDAMDIKVTAQGGVGTADEHNFLLEHYQVDSIGWGTPFLLVPEATTTDEATRERLVNAREEDLYLSGISPLGVPFNSLRGNTKDMEKMEYIAKGRPGSPCPKKYVNLNTEFTEKAICISSRQYQFLKLKELDDKNLSPELHNKEYKKIVDRSCICVGLGTAALLTNGLDTKGLGDGVSVCPGPNMAYYDQEVSLKTMIDHIYGRVNLIRRSDRPHMFVKELQLYVKYIKDKFNDITEPLTKKDIKYFNTFISNLEAGINYYKQLFLDYKHRFNGSTNKLIADLEKLLCEVKSIQMEPQMIEA